MGSRILLPAVSSRSARHLARSFNGSSQSNNFGSGYEEYTEPLLRRNSYDSSVHYESIYDSSEFSGSQRNRIEVMRKRLKSHFMTPYQKYKHRGRKPWKLLLQLLKLIMVTVQVWYVLNVLFVSLSYIQEKIKIDKIIGVSQHTSFTKLILHYERLPRKDVFSEYIQSLRLTLSDFIQCKLLRNEQPLFSTIKPTWTLPLWFFFCMFAEVLQGSQKHCIEKYSKKWNYLDGKWNVHGKEDEIDMKRKLNLVVGEFLLFPKNQLSFCISWLLMLLLFG